MKASRAGRNGIAQLPYHYRKTATLSSNTSRARVDQRMPVGDPRVVAIIQAAKEPNRLREHWLNPEGASEAELKKRTLTNLYNARPTWLANAHAALDRAACGWPGDEVPAEVAEDVIHSRLLALNGERAGER